MSLDLFLGYQPAVLRLVVAQKATVEVVKPHARQLRPVHGYVRHGRPRGTGKVRTKYTKAEQKLMAEAYPKIEGMALASTIASLARGEQMHFPDDAMLDATEAGLNALLAKADEAAIRGRIAGAVRDHRHWETSHGVTGTQGLLKTYYKAPKHVQEELRETTLPRGVPIEEGEALPTPSIEEAVMAASERHSREAVMAAVERRFAINLDRVRRMLGKTGRADPEGTLRAGVDTSIRMFERHLQGYSFREIGAEFGVNHMRAKRSYERVLLLMRQVAAAERKERHESGRIQALEARKAIHLDDVAQDRLQRALARHYDAVDLGLPVDFINNSRYLLGELLIEGGHYL